ANATILNDYVGVANIDDVYWTLQAEIKFYACIFLLLLLGIFRYTKIWLSLWLLVAVCYQFFEQPFFMGWFINPGYSFYFIGGVCSYLLYKNRTDSYTVGLLIISLLFSGVLSAKQIYQFYPSASESDGYIAALIVATFYLFFFLLSRGMLN